MNATTTGTVVAGDASDGIQADLQCVAQLSVEHASTLINATLDFLANPSKSAQFQDRLTELSVLHKLPVGPMKAATRGLLVFFKGVVRDGESPEIVASKFATFGLSAEYVTAVSAMWQKWSGHIASVALARSLAINRLVDMDWSFGVIAASDYSDHVGKTFLQIKLTIEDAHADRGVRDEYVEMTLEQFYHFLGQMEKCKAYMDLITS